MSIVTIRGQLGSGSPEIGKLVAQKIQADYVDREIIAEVAAQLQRREQDVVEKEMPPTDLFGRIAEAIWRSGAPIVGAPITGYYPVHLPAWKMPLDDACYSQMLESVIKELARSQPIVIRGRGSQFILKGHPDAIHILIVAPLNIRLRRVMGSLKMDEETAKKEIARSDSSSRAFIKRYFNAELEDPVNYDLVINTKYLSFADSASIIVNAISLKKIIET
jgi:CMP/dCMP kinase